METESFSVGMGKVGEAGTELGPTENLFSLTGQAVFINYLYMRYWVRMFVCFFFWRYNPLWLYFPQPGSGL
jgi:hypothetical protein